MESASQALEQQQATEMRPFQSLWGIQLSHCIITRLLSSGQKHSGCLVPRVFPGVTLHNRSDPVYGIFSSQAARLQNKLELRNFSGRLTGCERL